MGLLKFFGNQALDKIKKNLDDIQASLNEFDFSSKKNELEETFASLNKKFDDEFKKFANKIKVLRDKFVVEVPYDRDTQVLSYKLEDNVMSVVVETATDTGMTSFNSTATTTTTIPSYVSLEKVTQKYDKENKKMVFSFDKKFEEDANKASELLVDEALNEAEAEAERLFFEDIEEDNGAETERVLFDNVEEEDPRQALINKVIRLRNDGLSFKAISRECGISDKTAKRWFSKYAE